MLLPALAVAAGLALGLVRRSPHRHLAAPRLRAWPLLVAGLAAQLLSGLGAGTALVLLSYALLLAFAARNLHLVGMPVVLVGLALNAVVISANGGMPVRADALVAAGAVERVELTASEVDLGAKRHLEDGDDRLTFLGDIVPVRPAGRVVSFGDLILYVGLADVVAHLVRRGRRRADDDAPPPAWTADDDAAVGRFLAERHPAGVR